MSDTVLAVLISGAFSLAGIIANILYNARKEARQRRHDLLSRDFETFTSRHLEALLTFSELLGKLVRFDYQTWSAESKTVELVETRRAYNAALYTLCTFASDRTCRAILAVGNPVGKKEGSPEIKHLRNCLRDEMAVIRASLADLNNPTKSKPFQQRKRHSADDLRN